MHKSFLANFICGNYCWKNQEFAGSGVQIFVSRILPCHIIV